MPSPETTAEPPKLFPGDYFNLEGENWEVMAWETGPDGERQVFAQPCRNRHGQYTSRWPYKILQGLLS